MTMCITSLNGWPLVWLVIYSNLWSLTMMTLIQGLKKYRGKFLGLSSKTIQSLPSNTSAVETKLNKVVQELSTKLDSHCKSIEALPANAPDLTTTITSSCCRTKGKGETSTKLNPP